MTDKLTDNKIKKALECCSSFDKECKGCPLERMFDCNCINYNCKYALDLINRLQAENERLKKGWKADVILTANAKAEAYKEFVDKLCEGRVSNDNTVILAKCLLKELVGEDK